MPNYRRAHVPGGTYFFTVVTHRRGRLFQWERNRRLFGDAFRECQRDWPFQLNAIVLLPDHLHTIWTLPSGDDNYSGRWSVIKKTFTTRYLADGGHDWDVSAGKQRERRRGVWQRRFWEHTIEDEEDFEAHFDYIHYNPVKHKLVNCPGDWKPSSFHRWVKKGSSASFMAQARFSRYAAVFGVASAWKISRNIMLGCWVSGTTGT